MLSTTLSILGFFLGITMIQGGRPDSVGKGGTPLSVGSGYGHNDLCWKYCQGGLQYVGAALTAYPLENGCPSRLPLGPAPTPIPGETCYVSCDIRMDNIGNQLFGSPSTCGPDCFQITDSIISQVFEHMTKDRCPNVPAFNAISNITNPAVGSSTGTATYIICKTQLEEAASILFGMPVLNSQCLPPMGLLIPDNVGYAPTHSQYQVNLASVRLRDAQKGVASSAGFSALYSVSAVLGLVALAVVGTIFVHRKYGPARISRDGYNDIFDEGRIKHKKGSTRRNYGSNSVTAGSSSSFGI